jgi:hypothetical protein
MFRSGFDKADRRTVILLPLQLGTLATRRTVIVVGGNQPEAKDEEDDVIEPLPSRLVMGLTAHRTLALRKRRYAFQEATHAILSRTLVTN